MERKRLNRPIKKDNELFRGCLLLEVKRRLLFIKEPIPIQDSTRNIQHGTSKGTFNGSILRNVQFPIFNSKFNKEHSTRNFQGNVQRFNVQRNVQLPIFNFKIQQGTFNTELSRERSTVQLFKVMFNFQFQFKIQQGTFNTELSRERSTVQLSRELFNCQFSISRFNKEHSTRNFQGNVQRFNCSTVQLFNCQFSISRFNKEHSTRNFQGNVQRFNFQGNCSIVNFNFKIQQGTFNTETSREHFNVPLIISCSVLNIEY